MKPLTPRIRMRFIRAESSSFTFLDFEEAQDFTIAAAGEPFAVFLVGAKGAGTRFFLVFQFCPVYFHGTGKSTGKGRRDGAHQVVDLPGALRPVDAAVLGPAAA